MGTPNEYHANCYLNMPNFNKNKNIFEGKKGQYHNILSNLNNKLAAHMILNMLHLDPDQRMNAI
jgi:hypothetical protein